MNSVNLIYLKKRYFTIKRTLFQYMVQILLESLVLRECSNRSNLKNEFQKRLGSPKIFLCISVLLIDKYVGRILKYILFKWNDILIQIYARFDFLIENSNISMCSASMKFLLGKVHFRASLYKIVKEILQRNSRIKCRPSFRSFATKSAFYHTYMIDQKRQFYSNFTLDM